MNSNLKYILITIIALALLAIFVFGEKIGIELGSVFASIAGGLAIFKSKLLDKKASFLKHIDSSDDKADCLLVKRELDSKYKALQARLDYIEYKTKLNDLVQADNYKLSTAKNRDECSLTESEIIERLNS